MQSWISASMMIGAHVDSALFIVKKATSDIEGVAVLRTPSSHIVNLEL